MSASGSPFACGVDLCHERLYRPQVAKGAPFQAWTGDMLNLYFISNITFARIAWNFCVSFHVGGQTVQSFDSDFHKLLILLLSFGSRVVYDIAPLHCTCVVAKRVSCRGGTFVIQVVKWIYCGVCWLWSSSLLVCPDVMWQLHIHSHIQVLPVIY